MRWSNGRAISRSYRGATCSSETSERRPRESCGRTGSTGSSDEADPARRSAKAAARKRSTTKRSFGCSSQQFSRGPSARFGTVFRHSLPPRPYRSRTCRSENARVFLSLDYALFHQRYGVIRQKFGADPLPELQAADEPVIEQERRRQFDDGAASNKRPAIACEILGTGPSRHFLACLLKSHSPLFDG